MQTITNQEKSNGPRLNEKTLNVRQDTIDFNDRLYQPDLRLVPRFILPTKAIPVLHQGSTNACTGYALASVIHYLLLERRALEMLEQKARYDDDDSVNAEVEFDTKILIYKLSQELVETKKFVSSQMLYDMARRYDEWAGDKYEGSSARGAMKAWHKHGACLESKWKESKGHFSFQLAEDAAKRPLGAYYRVNHKDLVSVHSALKEVGILYATAGIHEGWEKPEFLTDPRRPFPVIRQSGTLLGGHAFVVTGYDEHGLFVQNSWGDDWGDGGIAQLTYDDWLDNAMDLWVARLGVPIKTRKEKTIAISRSVQSRQNEAAAVQDLNPHIISVGNDGRPLTRGTFATDPADITELFDTYILKKAGWPPKKTACARALEDNPDAESNGAPTDSDFGDNTKKNLDLLSGDAKSTTDSAPWKKIRLMIYAHGGLVSEETAVQRLSEYMAPCIDNEIFPIMISWNSDAWTTITNILKASFAHRSHDGAFVESLNYLLDRVDDTLEALARPAGKRMWAEMKENATLATESPDGVLRLFFNELTSFLLANDPDKVEVHFVAHSAGAIVLGPLVREFKKWNDELIKSGKTTFPIKTCTLWAPACTMQFYRDYYEPARNEKLLRELTVFTLTDKVEHSDNCAKLYNKSLLFLVSNAFEEDAKVDSFNPSGGTPLLGMSKWVKPSGILEKHKSWILSPNDFPPGDQRAARARSHGDFDNDSMTLVSTLHRILDAEPVVPKDFEFNCSNNSAQTARRTMQLVSASSKRY